MTSHRSQRYRVSLCLSSALIVFLTLSHFLYLFIDDSIYISSSYWGVATCSQMSIGCETWNWPDGFRIFSTWGCRLSGWEKLGLGSKSWTTG